MNIKGITNRQLAGLDFRDICADRGPFLRVIQGHQSGSSHAEHKALQALEKKGAMQRSRSAAWSLTVNGVVHAHLVHVPLLGMSRAGNPSEREQQSDRCISIDEDTLQLPKNARTFALEVRGDSMIEAHFIQGDVGLVKLRD